VARLTIGPDDPGDDDPLGLGMQAERDYAQRLRDFDVPGAILRIRATNPPPSIVDELDRILAELQEAILSNLGHPPSTWERAALERLHRLEEGAGAVSPVPPPPEAQAKPGPPPSGARTEPSPHPTEARTPVQFEETIAENRERGEDQYRRVKEFVGRTKDPLDHGAGMRVAKGMAMEPRMAQNYVRRLKDEMGLKTKSRQAAPKPKKLLAKAKNEIPTKRPRR
jgi:hypothetical protein